MCLHRLGLLSDVQAPLCGTPLDTLCAHLEKSLQYREGERDAIFLRETFNIEWPNQTKVYITEHKGAITRVQCIDMYTLCYT